MKKTLAITLVLLLSLSAIAATGEGTLNEVFPLDEPYTVSCFAFSNIGYDLADSLFMKTMEEKTNIHWDLHTFNSSDMTEKMNLSLNTGEYYDVYMKTGLSLADATKYGQQGVFIPLNDLIEDYMPNLKALLDGRDGWSAITSGDGSIYALPQIQKQGMAAPSVFINAVWLERVGMDVPETEEEFMDVLRAFKENDANGNGDPDDEYPIYCPAGAVEFTFVLFGIAMDYNTYSMYDGENMIYVPTSEQYKEFLAFWADAYKEGLINEDCFSATWDDINAIGAVYDTLGTIPTWGVYQHVGVERSYEYVDMLPFDGAYSIPTSNGIGYGALAITDKCTNPELICEWADYLYGKEGGALAHYGVEGETYTKNEDGVVTFLTENGYGSDADEICNKQTLAGWYNAPYSAMHGLTKGNPEELFLGKQRDHLLTRAAKPYPALSWTSEELEEKATLQTAINTYYYEYMAEVITGRKNLDETWDEYLATLKEMGVERLNEIDQAAYSRWYEDNK